MTNKKITLKLIGIDGNAFIIMNEFSKQAKKEKWSQNEIDEVINEATTSEYTHLLQTLMKYCK